MDLTGKVAIVTGAGQGIGRGIALKLAQRGADVVVAEFNEKTCEETAAEVRKLGRRALAARVDATNFEQVTEVVKKAQSEFGKIDILVNNVGGPITKPFAQTTPQDWDKDIAMNFKACLCFTRAVLGPMIERKGGKIINISSDGGRVGTANQAVYSAGKAGIIGFTKALAREVARYNILVNVVAPGTTNTPLTVQARGESPEMEKMFEALMRTIPLRRFGEPEDIAGAVAFFASDDANYVTGQVISVSGGGTMVG